MYRQVSNISHTKSQYLTNSCTVLQLSLLKHLSQMLSREWRCSWSSADRRCSNYIWVIDNFIAFKVRIILEVLRCMTVFIFIMRIPIPKKDSLYIETVPRSTSWVGVNSLAPGRPRCHFKTAIFNLVYLWVSSHHLRIMPWDEFQGTSLMISQHWFR